MPTFKIPTLGLLVALLMLTVGGTAVASDLYDTIDGLRAGDGECAMRKPMPSLKPQDALERAARRLARGDSLEESLAAEGYRAKTASVLSLSGDEIESKAAEILATQAYCPQWENAAISEVGIYTDARQVWIVLAAPFAAQAGLTEQTAGKRVLELVNQARSTPRDCGNRGFNAARPLRWNELLAKASQLHAEDMAQHNYFSHSGRDDSRVAQRVERVGYRYRVTGENIAAGQASPEDAVAGWIKSPTHCANLMNPAFTEMGVAFAVARESEMGVYWTQVFGVPR